MFIYVFVFRYFINIMFYVQLKSKFLLPQFSKHILQTLLFHIHTRGYISTSFYSLKYWKFIFLMNTGFQRLLKVDSIDDDIIGVIMRLSISRKADV